MSSRWSFNRLFSSVSKLVAKEDVVERKPTPQQKSHQQEIENSILVLAASVIRCDRNFTSETEVFLHEFLAKQFGASGKKRRADSVSSHIETGTEPFTKIACRELKMLTTYDSQMHILQFLFGIAAADNYVNAKEIRCIHRIAGYLGINDKVFKELKQNFLSKHSPYYVLGVEEDATFEQVKVAYRRLMLKYHPDKRRDANPEEAKLKFREIKKAFEIIKKESKSK